VKVCTKCKEEKSLDDFGKDKNRKDGRIYWCKKCIKQYRESKVEYNKKYRKNNREKLIKYGAEWRKKNIDKKRKSTRKWYDKNIKSIKKHNKEYREGSANYNTYASQISWCEEVRRNQKNKDYLQTKCTFCSNWFNPTNQEVCDRIKRINGVGRGELRFYCSKECKQACCLYWQQKYPKGFNKYEKYRIEVNYLTNKSFHKYYKQINPNNLKRGKEYNIDHIYSVANGFENNVSVEIIANPLNLQMLPAKENISKKDRSDMTKEELYRLYNQFKKEVK